MNYPNENQMEKKLSHKSSAKNSTKILNIPSPKNTK